MKIMPIEIRNQEFKKTMRGYDPVEVETFLELIAGEYETLLNENERLQKELVSMEADLKHFREAEKTLKQTLYNVQKTSQQSKENSVKEANLIKKEAQLAAIQLVERARSEVHKMQEDVRALKRQKNSLITRLKHVLSSQIELLEVLSIDDAPLKNKIKTTAKKSDPVQDNKPEPVKEETKSPVKEEKETPEIEMPAESKETESPAKSAASNKSEAGKGKEGKENGDDFFKDIFGDNIDIDEVLK